MSSGEAIDTAAAGETPADQPGHRHVEDQRQCRRPVARGARSARPSRSRVEAARKRLLDAGAHVMIETVADPPKALDELPLVYPCLEGTISLSL
ncbi:hypothetical protein [Sphingomonas sp.]|uniref:hypothetical protein n=1 Tax=Sphingomonas sp. TaxID=28214 RepID=UPI001B0618C7|nr:hypothetical protein [Sphingomonas sp.]MBO9712191.1 hypothetical protein [Sphingomonas sp.]